jgi:hypothetical protein
MSDVVIANYHARSAKGEIFNNPMTSERRIYETSLSNWTNYYGPAIDSDNNPIPTTGFDHTGTMSGERILQGIWYYPLPDLSDWLVGEAILKARANTLLTEADLLASLGESKETISFVTSNVGRLVRNFQRYRRNKLLIVRDFKRLSKRLQRRKKTEHLDKLLNIWMELRFAVRPMYYDVKQYVDYAGRDRAFTRKTGRGRTSGSKFYSDSGSSGAVFETVRVHWRQTTQIVRTVRAGTLIDIEMDGLKRELAYLGADNPFLSGWELVPLSWAVDYIFNIGDLISAHAPRVGIRELASWVTVTDDVTQLVDVTNLTAKGNPDTPRGRDISGSGFKRLSYRRTTRTPSPGIPVLPSLNPKLSAAKLVDLLAVGKGLWGMIVSDRPSKRRIRSYRATK